MQGVATAFSDILERHEEMVEICKSYFGHSDVTAPEFKMALIPTTADLLVNEGVPVVRTRNVYVLPGVPQLMKKTFESCRRQIFGTQGVVEKRVTRQELFFSLPEHKLTDALNRAVAAHPHAVTIGSYPEVENNYYQVRIVIESHCAIFVDQTVALFRTLLPPSAFVQFNSDPLSTVIDDVTCFTHHDRTLVAHVEHSTQVLKEAIKKYSPNDICLAFTGGKDCTVTLHLYHALLAAAGSHNLQLLHVQSYSLFPELESFIDSTKRRYGAQLYQFSGPMKDSLKNFKAQYPNVKAVIMGTRSKDPHSGGLSSFSPTDPGWPQLIRVNPVLNWSYQHIWSFIRALSLPYCTLYDRGYTSIGSVEYTHPNASLRYTDFGGVLRYRPAYELTDEAEERTGRLAPAPTAVAMEDVAKKAKAALAKKVTKL